MNPVTLNLLAVSVFAFTMLSLVGPLLNISPAAVAIAISGCAGVVAVDRFGAQGQGGNILIDLLSRRSPEYRERILHHEAGHFLVAHLLDIPVESYTLSAWEATRAGLPGLGGVVFDTAEIETAIAAGQLSSAQVNRYCTVWMAGIAAEDHVYGSAQGGIDDTLKLRALWQQVSPANRPMAAVETQLRWATLQAQTLIEQQQTAYQALVTAMASRQSVADCCAQIEQHRQVVAIADMAHR